ncbi:hypothetical protein MUA57_01775 [Staphylococcus simulans]|uniref:hypothetical protein n=1 Tax=Staphylococcus simulans TaxID=1286 RepID=UPI0021D1935D|nr:hypothetical protein [Staphylococcus simulans]UXR47915.1 hypothetical protein MUA57_01775 [Staphylococcus simulans]
MATFLSTISIVILYVVALFTQHYILRHTNKKYKFVVPIVYSVILLVLFLTHIINLPTFIIFFILGAVQLFGLEQQLKRHEENKQKHSEADKKKEVS